MISTNPNVVQKKAIDVTPYNHALWCSIGDGEPFANMIYWRCWSDNGERILFGMDTHNGFSAKPDELVGVVKMTDRHMTADYLERKLKEDAEKMAKRPTKPVQTAEQRELEMLREFERAVMAADRDSDDLGDFDKAVRAAIVELKRKRATP